MDMEARGSLLDKPGRSKAPPGQDAPIASRTAPQEAREVIDGDRPDALDNIRAPGCAVSIWRRDLSGPFRSWLDGLSTDTLPSMRVTMRPEHARSMLQASIGPCDETDGAFRKELVEDAAALAGLYARVMETSRIRIRLDVISDNACRKFHLDNVAARLLCSYRGRGTQYGIKRVYGDPDPIHELRTGDVGLFRGQLWSADERSTIVHRSPPISAPGETRLLLVIDDGGPAD